MNYILNLVMCRGNEDLKELIYFLDTVKAQRNIRKEDVLVTVMQFGDGKELDAAVSNYPELNIDVIHTNCDTRARAYNQFLLKSNAEWIMFMDYGDFFPDVYAVSMMVNLFPTQEWDIAWTEHYNDFQGSKGWVNIITDVQRGLHGKLFRRNFLIENGVFFDEALAYDEGDVFFTVAQSITDYSRFAKISTRFVPYAHFVPETTEIVPPEEIIEHLHLTNMASIRDLNPKRSGYLQSVMHAICIAYFFIHTEPVAESLKKRITADIIDLCRKNSVMINHMKQQDIEVFLDEAQTEIQSICNNAYVRYGHEMYFEEDGDTFDKWLGEGCKWKKVEKRPPKKPSKPGKEPKVAVFCGTRNVYDCMETAAKSLMYHTKMDRIYFFIEDDQFPNPLPKEIRCINVSGQTWFDPHGPNFSTSWTYMCMVRAAFAKLMPDEHKVLSLDIDVVVNEDISELWEIDLHNYCYAGVPEPERSLKKNSVYANFGVIMMNLDLIRESKIDEIIISSLNRDRWGCPEQDAFNHFCKGKVLALPPKYNATRAGHITAETEEEKISHYAGIKYWKQFKPFRKYAGMSWEEVMKHK